MGLEWIFLKKENEKKTNKTKQTQLINTHSPVSSFTVRIFFSRSLENNTRVLKKEANYPLTKWNKFKNIKYKLRTDKHNERKKEEHAQAPVWSKYGITYMKSRTIEIFHITGGVCGCRVAVTLTRFRRAVARTHTIHRYSYQPYYVRFVGCARVRAHNGKIKAQNENLALLSALSFCFVQL